MEEFRQSSSERNRGGDSGFGLRFRLLLGYHDLTLKDVSEVTGAAISTVSTWRNGRIPSSRDVIERIAQLFHVTPAYLLYGGTATESDVDPSFWEISSGMPQKRDHDQLLRRRIELYFGDYLNEAEKYEGGLEHTWLQLVREFPAHWFQNAGEIVARKSSKDKTTIRISMDPNEESSSSE
ncbi:MAG: helix-turn-helix domain-containing protein [Opitutales bacterium]|nr:helix-turn-helix domain-containing protein [Opitutales bacterium]